MTKEGITHKLSWAAFEQGSIRGEVPYNMRWCTSLRQPQRGGGQGNPREVRPE